MTSTTEPKSTRYPATNRLLTLLDEERITPEAVIGLLMNYLSEDEIAEMLDMIDCWNTRKGSSPMWGYADDPVIY